MNNPFPTEHIALYRENFLKFGDTPEGVLWNNQNSQYLRFERLLKNFNLSKRFSIHDIGCGTCGLHEYLLHENINHDYHGSELVSEMVSLSKKKFKHINVFERDILSSKNIETCDFGVISGTFNLAGNSTKEMWHNYVFSIIQKLFSISSSAISVNFLSTYNTFTDDSLSYFDPRDVMDFCIKNLSRFLILDHSLHLCMNLPSPFSKKTL